MRQLASSKTYLFRWEVNSRTEPDKTYVVSMKHDGTWGCSCPRWIFNRERPRPDCHHIEHVKGVEPRVEAPSTGPYRPEPSGRADHPVVLVPTPQPYFVLQTRRTITFEE